jgi:hypothetical protein
MSSPEFPKADILALERIEPVVASADEKAC